jgi:uncharacterized membrane protein YdjX (TVP38/TMEM64 family)
MTHPEQNVDSFPNRKPSVDTRSSWWRLAAFVILLAGCVGVSFHPAVRKHFDPQGLHNWVQGAGSVALLVYLGALVLGEILWMPRMLLITAGGLLFSPLWAGMVSIGADMVAGTLFFWAAGGLARPTVRAWLKRSPRLQEAMTLVSKNHGVAAVALLRICPVAHYTAFSYACGLSDVRFRRYVVGTFVGVLPGAVLYPFFGSAVLHPGSPVFWLAAVSLVIFLVGTFWLGRKILKPPPENMLSKKQPVSDNR